MRADFTVPPAPMRGLPADAPLGGADGAEGELCLRPYDGRVCLGVIEYLKSDRDPDGAACTCHMGHPPCGYCMSSAPTCVDCGWRDEE